MSYVKCKTTVNHHCTTHRNRFLDVCSDSCVIMCTEHDRFAEILRCALGFSESGLNAHMEWHVLVLGGGEVCERDSEIC